MAPKLPVSARSHEKRPNFKKTSTPPGKVPCRKILNDFLKAVFVINTIPSLHYYACRDPLSEDFLYDCATVTQLGCAATRRRLNKVNLSLTDLD